MRNSELNSVAVARALAECTTLSEASRRLGCTRATLYKYKTDPQVQELMMAIASQAVAKNAVELANKSADYDSILESIATDTSAPQRDRIDAVKVLIQHSETLFNRVDVNTRLRAIEDRLGTLGGF